MLRNFLFASATLGAVVPVLVLVLSKPLAPMWVRYIWPTFIFLGATIGDERTLTSAVIVALSILGNVVVYTLSALLALGIFSGLRNLFRKGAG